MRNNLFKFATKELSQDAFLCWCLNWFNYPESALFPMAEELMGILGETGLMRGLELDIRQQVNKIDILIILKGKNRVMIIEDKTTSSEHDDQIARYCEMIRDGLSRQDQESMGIDSSVEVRTVFFKTGFHYDYDRETVADIKVTGPDFLKILEKYVGRSEILDDYVTCLRERIEWYAIHGKYDAVADDRFWDWDISQHQIAQYQLMHDMLRERFPEWEQGKELYKIRHGTNVGGRPWTELTFLEGVYPNSTEWYYVFWRIDTDKNGPYISLRFYEKYEKADETKRSRHVHAYEMLREQAEGLLEGHRELGLQWDNVKGRNSGGRFESTILTICLKEPLKGWSVQSGVVKRQILVITDYFLQNWAL